MILGGGGGGGGGIFFLLFLRWVCAARDSKLGPCSDMVKIFGIAHLLKRLTTSPLILTGNASTKSLIRWTRGWRPPSMCILGIETCQSSGQEGKRAPYTHKTTNYAFKQQHGKANTAQFEKNRDGNMVCKGCGRCAVFVSCLSWKYVEFLSHLSEVWVYHVGKHTCQAKKKFPS